MPELARPSADGVIDRSSTRDTPIEPLARYVVALVLGTLVAETILASVQSWAHRQAGHMDASDLIKSLQTSCEEGAVHIWFYADLKAYRAAPTARRRSEMRARFDRIFHRRTGFATLDRLLERLHANKPELLMVLDRPEIPLHTNGSERDIRCHVIKRKISGGTRSDAGRDCRDAFLGLMHTCTKLGIAFWDYLGDRLGIIGHPKVPALPDLIRCRGRPA
jgi:hypothetical protein